MAKMLRLILEIGPVSQTLGFSDGSAGKESSCNARDTRDAGSFPGLGRFPGEENGNPLQYSCLENSMDRGAWWATVHGVAKSQTEQLNKHACLISHKAQGGGLLSVNDIRITDRTCYIDKGWVPLPETLIPEV